MKTLKEIETRLSEISEIVENEEKKKDLTLDEIKAFDTEVTSLQEEQRAIKEAIESREKELREAQEFAKTIKPHEQEKEIRNMEIEKLNDIAQQK